MGIAIYIFIGLSLALREQIVCPRKTVTQSTTDMVDPGIYDADYYLKAYAGDKKKYLNDLSKLPIGLSRCFHLADPKPGEMVLDLGCGRGAFSYYCAARGCLVTGVDYSDDAVRLALMAREELPAAYRNNLKVYQMDFRDFDESKKFDVIVMADLVEHLYDHQLRELFAKTKRLLKPGTGKLIIHTAPNKLFIDVIFPLKRILNWPGIVRSKKMFFYKRDKYSYDAAMHINEQTPASIKSHLKDFRSRVWCDDGSANVISQLTCHFAGADIWAVASLPPYPKEPF